MINPKLIVHRTVLGLVVHRRIGEVESLHCLGMLIFAKVGDRLRWWWELR